MKDTMVMVMTSLKLIQVNFRTDYKIMVSFYSSQIPSEYKARVLTIIAAANIGHYS
jgi:hypothetical protein